MKHDETIIFIDEWLWIICITCTHIHKFFSKLFLFMILQLTETSLLSVPAVFSLNIIIQEILILLFSLPDLLA